MGSGKGMVLSLQPPLVLRAAPQPELWLWAMENSAGLPTNGSGAALGEPSLPHLAAAPALPPVCLLLFSPGPSARAPGLTPDSEARWV